MATIRKLPSGNHRIEKMINGKRLSMVLEYRPRQREADLLLYELYKNQGNILGPDSFSAAAEKYIRLLLCAQNAKNLRVKCKKHADYKKRRRYKWYLTTFITSSFLPNFPMLFYGSRVLQESGTFRFAFFYSGYTRKDPKYHSLVLRRSYPYDPH